MSINSQNLVVDMPASMRITSIEDLIEAAVGPLDPDASELTKQPAFAGPLGPATEPWPSTSTTTPPCAPRLRRQPFSRAACSRQKRPPRPSTAWSILTAA